MVTNYPQVLVQAQPRGRTGRRFGARFILRLLGQTACAIRGHELLWHYERGRVALECGSCGYVSPGWQLDGPGPQRRFAGDPHRHQIKKVEHSV